MTNQELLRALKEYVNSDLVDVELNPRKRIAIEAIAEAEKQEPHSWYSAELDEWMTEKTRKDHERLNSYTHKVGGFDLALYTTPQQRKPLTDEQIDTLANAAFENYMRDKNDDFDRAFARAIEAAHGIKE